MNDIMEAISQLTPANQASSTLPFNTLDSIAQPSSIKQGEGPATNFMALIKEVDSTIKTSNTNIKDYIVGKDISTHDIMIALEKAEHSIRISVEIRNKLVEAYDNITRMRL